MHQLQLLSPSPSWTTFFFNSPADETLTGTLTPDQSEPENGNKGAFHIPQSSRIGAYQSDGLVSCSGQPLCEVGSYRSAEMQLAYFTAAADWATEYFTNLDVTCRVKAQVNHTIFLMYKNRDYNPLKPVTYFNLVKRAKKKKTSVGSSHVIFFGHPLCQKFLSIFLNIIKYT